MVANVALLCLSATAIDMLRELLKGNNLLTERALAWFLVAVFFVSAELPFLTGVPAMLARHLKV